MAEKIITATLHNLSPVPLGAVYQGDGMFEFVAEVGTVLKEVPVIDEKGGVKFEMREIAMSEPYNIEKKYAEYDIDKGTYYKDPAVKVELTSDLIAAEKEKTEKITKVDLDGKEIRPVDPKDEEIIKPVKK